MNYGSDSGPLCNFCGRKLSRNELSGQYECLSCTFQRMESDDAIEVETSSGNQQNYYESPAQQEYQELLKIKAFQEHLHNSAPGLVVTKLIILINVLVHVYVMSITKNYEPDNLGRLYIDMGANIGLLTFGGEWWRIITSMFIHGGLTHLIFNMYALWAIGSIVEKLFGSFGFICLYFISGVIGSVFSLYNHTFNVPSVGASGAVFGVFGALVSYAYFKKMPKPIASSVLKNAGFMILINGAIGFSIPQIDNAAHIGGCIGGIIAAYFIGQDITNLNFKKRQINSIIVCICCAILVASTWNIVKEKNSRGLSNIKSNFEKKNQERIDFINEFNDLEVSKETEISNIVSKFKNKLITKEEAITILRRDYIDFFKKKGEVLQKYNEECLIPEFMVNYTKKYIELYLSFWDLYKKYFETSDTIYLSQAKLMKMKVDGLRPEDFR
ncbi:MAG: rhomboid family intramembrane serine protease [Lentisphaeraceae bacterium]|nr:rhomboid family intramembrane serine protease [Lentisphaeraceae bacterium]